MRKTFKKSAPSAPAWAASAYGAAAFAGVIAALNAVAPVRADPAARGPAPIALAAKANAPGSAVRASDVAGRYTIFREGDKDTGCMLTLDDKAKVKGGNRATLAPACRDQGLVIFDPVAWRIVNDHLVLRARKGHTTSLDLEADGTWAKDPKEGKSLSLKKQ
jgi:hypothetical protein